MSYFAEKDFFEDDQLIQLVTGILGLYESVLTRS